MNWVSLALISSGYFLLDCGLKNRSPYATIEALIKDPSDLSGTLVRLNGTWVTPSPGSAGDTSSDRTSLSNNGGAIPAGQQNGRLKDSDLAAVPFAPGHRLTPAAVEALVKLNEAYKAEFGRNISITDSYRTYAQQVTTKKNRGWLAATPGTSNHGWGKALDLGGGINVFGTKQHNWMKANAGRFGWMHPSWAARTGSKPEPWHWEFVG